MRKMIRLVLPCLLVLVYSDLQAAKVTRHCDADIRLDLHSKHPFPVKNGHVLERYSASGRASGANAARRKARTNARQCAGVTWQERWHTIPPNQSYIFPQCRSNNRVNNFGMDNIKCRIHNAVCAIKNQQGRHQDDPAVATIYLATWGQTSACLSSHLYSDQYTVFECTLDNRIAVCGN